MAEAINLATGISGWLAPAQGRPRGGLVVIQEIFGVTAHIKAVAEDYASQGYTVIAPCFFDHVEPGIELPYDEAGLKRGRELAGEVGLDQAVDDVAAAAHVLAEYGRVGTVGYCWGGTVALLAALRLGLPSVSYYGARNVQFLQEQPQAPVIFHFGAEDGAIPREMLDKHRQAWPQLPLYTYPGAGHAFNRDVDPKHYHAASATLARERSLTFFAEHL